ncbi:MAG: glucose-6-phosphate isomerase [Pseudomonadales bacterium]
MPTAHPQWQVLHSLAADSNLPSLAQLVQQPRQQLVCSAAGLTADLQKQRINDQVLTALIELANASGLEQAKADLFAGERINRSENRAVGHMALRTPEALLTRHLTAGSESSLNAEQVSAEIRTSRQALATFSNAVANGEWRGLSGQTIDTVINIGIGGSHLGPELALSALAGTDGLRVRFLSNVDGDNLQRCLAHANPARTLFVIASKSFSTQETAVNAQAARAWFLERTGSLAGIGQHFVAVTNNLDAAAKFGIPANNLFAMGDWVGGRYSMWSAVGLAIALGIGWSQFEALLAGAAAMDEHFLSAEPAVNIPVLMALAGIWNSNFLGCETLAILPYDDRLRLLPDFLQQLEMESNGKRVRQDGSVVDYHTSPIIWGGRGTNGQHAFHQLLHQGTRRFCADFVLCREASHGHRQHHQTLLANALAQSQALASGRQHDDSHRAVPGGHPSTTIVLERLAPENLGALLAAYEHKVFCQGVIWHINSFDQWGVELGKELAGPIQAELEGSASHEQDAATRALIDLLLSH